MNWKPDEESENEHREEGLMIVLALVDASKADGLAARVDEAIDGAKKILGYVNETFPSN